MNDNNEMSEEEIGEPCEWCGSKTIDPYGYGPYGEAYCGEVCAENIDREVREA